MKQISDMLNCRFVKYSLWHDSKRYLVNNCTMKVLMVPVEKNRKRLFCLCRSLEESIGTPLFVMLRFLSSTPEEDPSRQPLLQLLGEMYTRQPRIGYHLLYFLKVG